MQIKTGFWKGTIARRHAITHFAGTNIHTHTHTGKNQFYHISRNCLYIQNEHVYIFILTEMIKTTTFVTHFKFSYFVRGWGEKHNRKKCHLIILWWVSFKCHQPSPPPSPSSCWSLLYVVEKSNEMIIQ